MTGAAWSAWIGATEHARDTATSALARRWQATFDLSGADAATDALPQGIHFCLCVPDTPTVQLGEDGHPVRDNAGGFLPPVPLPRRMWAASAIHFDAPIPVGAAVERTSRIAAVTDKSGRSGPLTFVDVRHTLTADGVPAVRETQTLVYRAAADPDAPLSPQPGQGGAFVAGDWERHRSIVPDPRLLFRYSALTFNTHRIHYDWPYARTVERYRGLVVHGPLIASLLLQLAARAVGENRLASFTFTGVSPAIAGEPLHLVMREEDGALTLAAFAEDGRQVTRASARLS